ncbi:helix-turn-helix domain-containing protein [Curtobacterium poinsettiae]|uniref:helix-turn-helix domain-containing protein n=1 Tax=Curtobacterium poinsettiae TaxID=159612 RepID=UPI00217D9A8B|nr:helix-turn-helix domain-containing protein [Curtobacterium flaccumfaciens]MCS6579583.1 helix-turn-helix domain-containing protein [Curtobacterium flaccumfaciens]
MTAEALDVRAELRALIEHRSVALEAIAQMTGISESTLSAYLAGPGTEHHGLTALGTGLTPDESQRLAVFAAMLAAAGSVPDDDRVRGMLEGLTQVSGLTVANIAWLTGIAESDLDAFSEDPTGVSDDVKYAIATRTSYLVNAVNLATSRR